jgi:hypothetical protein
MHIHVHVQQARIRVLRFVLLNFDINTYFLSSKFFAHEFKPTGIFLIVCGQSFIIVYSISGEAMYFSN